jgi:YfiH family protein
VGVVELLRGRPGVLPPGVVHGFTARSGGVAPSPRDALTLARHEALDDALVEENWRRALRAIDPGLAVTRLALARQVHGRDVAVVEEPTGPLGHVGEVDALVTTVPGLAIAVRVADCVPVVIGAEGGVAAVHAGWRGAAAGVVGEALHALVAATGVDPSRMGAVVGPHISGARYEVGPEVIDGIAAAGVPTDVFARRGRGDRWLADVGAAVAWQLREAGVGRIDATGGCTTEPRFFSWRTDGPDTGRQAGIVAWNP